MNKAHLWIILFIYQETKKIKLYAKFLQGLGYKTTKRSHFLTAAQTNFPRDVVAITTQLVQNIRVDKGENNTRDHVEDKMNALRCLAQQENADEKFVLSHSNHLFRLFWDWKISFQHPTLSSTFNRFSHHELLNFGLSLTEAVAELRPGQTGWEFVGVPGKVRVNKNTQEGWEFACWSQYYRCVKRVQDFFEFFSGKPDEPGTDRITWENMRNKHRDEAQRWIQETVELCARRIAPEVGCVPDLIGLLARIFLACGDYQQCVGLADYVAGQTLCLYEFFKADQMQLFLGTMREAFLQTLPTEQVNPGPMSIHH